MKSSKVKFYLAILFILFTALLSLPSFNFKIGDTEINFPNINFSLISPYLPGGDFEKGKGIFPENEIKAKLTLAEGEVLSDEAKQKIISTLQKRADNAGLSDISMQLETSDGTSYLKLTFPKNIDDVESIAKWLISKGEMSFIALSSDGSGQLSLRDTDLLQNFHIEYSNQVLQGSDPEGNATNVLMGSHLVTYINPNIYEEYKAFVTSSQSPILMSIDSIGTFYLISDSDVNTGEITPKIRFWTTAPEFENAQTKLRIYNIIRTYLTEAPLSHEIKVDLAIDPIVESHENLYSLSRVNLAIGFIFMGFAILVYAFFKLKLKNFKKFFVYFTSAIFAWTFLMKLFSANLSIGIVIGFVIYFVLVTIFCLQLSRTIGKEEFDARSLQNKKYFAIILFMIVPLNFIGFVSPASVEILTSVAVGMIVLWGLHSYNFKFIFENYKN